MPITFLFVCLFFFGIILAVFLIPVSIILLVFKEKKAALLVFLLPVCLLLFSVLMPLIIFGSIGFHNLKMNVRPIHTFNTTFGFLPNEQTEILGSYVNNGLDFGTTLIKFKTTRETIDKIVQKKFHPITSETFQEKLSYRNNFPEHVREWFKPDLEKSNLFYLTEPFQNTFSNVNEAILCYDEETGIAYFKWVGLD